MRRGVASPATEDFLAIRPPRAKPQRRERRERPKPQDRGPVSVALLADGGALNYRHTRFGCNLMERAPLALRGRGAQPCHFPAVLCRASDFADLNRVPRIMEGLNPR